MSHDLKYKLTGKGYDNKYNQDYWEARRIHVFLLRCEGLTYKQIANRLGMNRQGARVVHYQAIHLLMWAWRHILQPHTMKEPKSRY
jgi:transcriptional regulator